MVKRQETPEQWKQRWDKKQRREKARADAVKAVADVPVVGDVTVGQVCRFADVTAATVFAAVIALGTVWVVIEVARQIVLGLWKAVAG
jgi:hypothetical protein